MGNADPALAKRLAPRGSPRDLGAVLVAITAAAVLVPAPAAAVDTVETWDAGAADVDFYLGFDGLGLGRQEREISGSIMIGYGLIQRFSAYLGAEVAANDYLENGVGKICLGLFGTPVDTDHFDLDLFLNLGLGGPGFGEFHVGPAVELNFDLAPDLELWGIYVVAGMPFCRQASTDSEQDTAVSIETTVGMYLTLASRHQILLDYTMAFHPVADQGDRRVEVGSVGLGYNVVVHEALELITEVRVDVPQEEGEPVVAGFVVGLIATLPSGRPATGS